MRIGIIVRSVVLSLVLAGVAFAAGIDGKWKAEFSAQDGQKVENVFTFKVEGEKVTGTVYSSLASSEAKIEEGVLKGDDLTFGITRNFGGGDVKFRYKGKVSGDEIALTASATIEGQSFGIPMTAKRQKS